MSNLFSLKCRSTSLKLTKRAEGNPNIQMINQSDFIYWTLLGETLYINYNLLRYPPEDSPLENGAVVVAVWSDWKKKQRRGQHDNEGPRWLFDLLTDATIVEPFTFSKTIIIRGLYTWKPAHPSFYMFPNESISVLHPADCSVPHNLLWGYKLI